MFLRPGRERHFRLSREDTFTLRGSFDNNHKCNFSGFRENILMYHLCEPEVR